jgi:predicted transcriptional regulator of viral defense system
LNNLKNWEEKEYLINLRKGLYLLGEFIGEIDPLVLALKIYSPSYVSLEMALSSYGIIPESVFTVTSVSSRKTKFFENKFFGKYCYQKIKKEAFGGFETRKFQNISFNFALPEKALVDFLYLNRNILDGSRENFESYRFSKEFNYNKKKLRDFSELFENKKTIFLTDNFIRYYASN